MDGELPRSGHSYFGIVGSAQEAHAILEASKLGLLPRVTRRLTDEERLRFVRAGAVFVWEEEEAGIRRWTDHIKWSPSRVSGAFLTYSEVPSRGEDSLIKQSFSSVDSHGTKMHLIAYTAKSSAINSSLPAAARDPLIQRMLAQRSTTGRDPREQPAASTSKLPPPPSSDPAPPFPYPATHPPAGAAPHQYPPRHPPPLAPPRFDFRRSHSSSVDVHSASRPRSCSAADEQRPYTSASEPRPSSSYEPNPQHSQSLAFPSLTSHRTSPHAPTSLSAASSPVLLPPLAGSPGPWPFAFDAVSASSSRLPSFFGSPAPSMSPTISPPSTAPPSTGPSASPFDFYPRQLPPLDGFPPVGASPPRYLAMQGTFLDDDGSGQRGESAERPSTARNAEDERQLRLLGRWHP
ncbi:hypothetical protein JCM8097_003113 [Rhodosporidiobolus ruineniae]